MRPPPPTLVLLKLLTSFLASFKRKRFGKKGGFVKLEYVQMSMKGEQGSVYSIRLSSRLSHLTQVKLLCTLILLEKQQ